jgi:nanoRNase/pAp phosphatase (c-di-AMP/oligoRNAs hydrolase)
MDERLDRLLRAVEEAHSVLILPHNDPDPDAIASAVALRHLLAQKLGVKSQIAYEGMIGRAENRALVRFLGRPLRRLAASDLPVQAGTPGKQATAVALVDTQPGTGHNPLPPDWPVTVVIDHHPWQEASHAAAFCDVRPNIGATSTILTAYLQAAGIDPPRRWLPPCYTASSPTRWAWAAMPAPPTWRPTSTSSPASTPRRWPTSNGRRYPPSISAGW